MRSLAIGLDLGGTQIRGALVDAEGTILSRRAEATPASAGAAAVVAALARVAQEVGAQARGAEIVGLGLSAPGPLDAEKGLALATPTIAGFVDFPLAAELSAATGLPVRLENDGIAAAIGEWRFGAARGLGNMVYATVSTGIGGGAVVDGRVLRGRMGMAAHIGHMTVVQGGERCVCGNAGCFEAYASGTAFLAKARRLATLDAGSALHAAGAALTGAAVFEAAAAGDDLARRLVDDEAEMLGLGFVNLLHLYSPQMIVVGGGMSHQFAALGPAIAAYVARNALPPFRDVPVVRAALGDNSGLVGAGAIAFEAAAPAQRRLSAAG
ncbi:ROK family protein [Aurantimonas sp. Leaf443]|uniref:ROK family protein n=1 Tax=Aurantimonas sp. Leaf443 TaxID=1736378 RepID=UPI000702142A|nr:ROK family protein [Aurantimonas sp. Leaf443]KQT84070.1 glucokinase [Aurantimonas sp. Leaf443]